MFPSDDFPAGFLEQTCLLLKNFLINFEYGLKPRFGC